MGLRKIVLLVGLAFPLLAGAGIMNLFSGFTIEREVVIEPQQYTKPGKLARAADGGYFVLGEGTLPWIVKTDSDGKELWSYREPSTDEAISHFEMAAPAADGGVLVCGSQEKATYIPGKGRRNVFTSGLVVRLDKNGHEVERLARPAGDESYELTTYKSCARWGDGFVVIGDNTGLYKVLRLRNDGTPIWQKDINLGNGAGSGSMPQAMSNGDLVFLGIDSVARIDANGNLLGQTSLDVGCKLLMHTEATDQLEFICHTNWQGHVPEIVEFSPDLQVLNRTRFPISDDVGVSRGYALPDGSLVLFGLTRPPPRSHFIPTVFLYSRGGSLIAKHEFEKSDEGGIEDGMPTGKPGEFVIIRPTVIGPYSKTAMTFLRR